MADRATFGPDDRNWWLIGNAHGGLSVAYGHTAAAARGDARDAIAEAFLEEGLSRSAARRGAQSYRVGITAGGLTYDEARAARDDWDAGGALATALRRRWLTETGQRLDRWMIEEDQRTAKATPAPADVPGEALGTSPQAEWHRDTHGIVLPAGPLT